MVHVVYWGRHGRCYGEGCSHDTHCPVLAELGCYYRHAISLYPIQDCSDPEWKAHMDEVGSVFQVHYHSGWAYMARYAQHLFQLQHDT
jgi:hypothetical protein